MSRWSASFGFVLLLAATAAVAHHSYAMFDKTRSVVVAGSIATVEWINPHTIVWMYVKKENKPGEYDLFGFENAGPNGLTLNGWTRDSLKTGDKVSIRYFPLRDGGPGGYLIWVERADGTRLMGDKGAFGVEAELQRLEKEEATSPAASQPGSGK
jgi:hypothetical protein